MHFDLIVKNGVVASSQGLERADVGILKGRIAEVGDLSQGVAAEILDATGLVVMPGVIDTQVHFREPGLTHKEDLESGTRAAIMGGVTTIFEMPNTQPPTISRETLEDKLVRAEGRAWCHFAFFIGASAENADSLGDLEGLPGAAGVKIFMGSSTGPLLVADDETLLRVLRSGSRRCPVHAEDEPRLTERKSLISPHPHVREHPFLRDAEAARLATERIIRLGQEAGRPIHILHVSDADELPLISDAKLRGQDVTAEITPQHLYFSAPDCYDRLGTLAQMNPPIREEEHRQALWRAVKGGLFDVMGSDHAPHTLEEKAKPYPQSPSGVPGVQTMLPVFMTFARRADIRIEDVVRLGCEGPARIYGLDRKGFVRPGFDADLTLVDPGLTLTVERSMIQSKCEWSPFEGEDLTGWPVHVLLSGEIVVREQELVGRPKGKPAEFNWK